MVLLHSEIDESTANHRIIDPVTQRKDLIYPALLCIIIVGNVKLAYN